MTHSSTRPKSGTQTNRRCPVAIFARLPLLAFATEAQWPGRLNTSSLPATCHRRATDHVFTVGSETCDRRRSQANCNHQHCPRNHSLIRSHCVYSLIWNTIRSMAKRFGCTTGFSAARPIQRCATSPVFAAKQMRNGRCAPRAPSPRRKFSRQADRNSPARDAFSEKCRCISRTAALACLGLRTYVHFSIGGSHANPEF